MSRYILRRKILRDGDSIELEAEEPPIVIDVYLQVGEVGKEGDGLMISYLERSYKLKMPPPPDPETPGY